MLLVGLADDVRGQLAERAVTAVPSVAAALAAVQDWLPDLVVSAVGLPDAEGSALATALARSPTTQSVPVVLLSESAQTRAGLAAALAAWVGSTIRQSEEMEPTLAPADLAFLDLVVTTASVRLDAPSFGARALAAAVGLSPRQFRRRLGAVTGETPSALLRRLRLEWAAALLGGGMPSVKEVAHRVGFASASGFRDAFREAFGVPPATYARRPR